MAYRSPYDQLRLAVELNAQGYQVWPILALGYFPPFIQAPIILHLSTVKELQGSALMSRHVSSAYDACTVLRESMCVQKIFDCLRRLSYRFGHSPYRKSCYIPNLVF